MDNENIVNRVKAAVNYFKLIGEQLGTNHRMSCPIHKDAINKTSFTVLNNGNYAYCHSCGFKGDIFNFIMETKKCGFTRALEKLSKIAGIKYKLWQEAYFPDREAVERVLRDTVEIWHENLMKYPEGVEYLKSRGVTLDDIIEYRIGYAGPKGTTTTSLFRNKHLLEHIIKSGIVKEKAPGNPEHYINRFVFPLWSNGKPVYSIGRHDEKRGGPIKDGVPKYMKHRITEYVDHVLYGEDVLYNKEITTVMIVEGVFDFFAAKQLGYHAITACAGIISGKQLERYIPHLKEKPEIIICFDWDRDSEAGQNNQFKLAEKLREHGINAKLLKLTPPDNYPADTKSYDLADLVQNNHRLNIDNIKTFDQTQIAQIQNAEHVEPFLKTVVKGSSSAQLEDIKKTLREEKGIPFALVNAIIKDLKKPPPEKIIAERLIEEHGLVYHASHGYRRYNKGMWEIVSLERIGKWVVQMIQEHATGSKITSIERVMRSMSDVSLPNEENPFDRLKYRRKYIPLRNGFLDLDTWKLEPQNKNALFTFQIDVEYDPNAECKRWLKFIHEVTAGDEEQANMLQEIFGYCFMADNRLEKIFIMHGLGSNGKSIFLNAIEHVLGDAVSSIPISMLEQRFAMSSLYGKLANITTEDKGDLIECSSLLKAISSGESIMAERKHKNAFRFKPYCKIICAMNEIPRTKDTSFGFFRRVELVDWPVRFTDNDSEVRDLFVLKKDVHLMKEIKNEASGIFNWGLIGLKRLMKNDKFTLSKEHIERQSVFREEVDVVYAFFKEMVILEDLTMGQKYQKDNVYMLYRNWCIEGGYKPLSAVWFFRKAKESDLITKEDLRERCMINGKNVQKRMVRLVEEI